MLKKRGIMLSIKELSWQKKIIFWIVLVVGLILFWLGINLLTMDTSLNSFSDYKLPELINLENIYESESGNFAVAINGKVVTNPKQETPKILPTASTIKMVLALAVMKQKPFEFGEKGETITITLDDYNKFVWYANNGGSYTPVQVGEEISEYDALVSILLASSNNMAETLAEWAFGSIDEYRNVANEMLNELGLFDTRIGDNITGYDTSSTSTASDLAKIGNELLNNPVLKEIVGTKNYNLPVAGMIENTNRLLGVDNIIGIKTGYSDAYNLVSAYQKDNYNITVALLGESTRASSFDKSLAIVRRLQEKIQPIKLVGEGQVIGHFDSWWTGKVPITAEKTIEAIALDGAEISEEFTMDGNSGTLEITIDGNKYSTPIVAGEYNTTPNFGERLKHIFGWKNDSGWEVPSEEPVSDDVEDNTENQEQEIQAEPEKPTTNEEIADSEPFTNAKSNNCTIQFGKLMLINPNFTVEESFIATRRSEMVSLSAKYGIVEGLPGNGDNLLDAEAGVHINEMINAYKSAYPGHTLETRSCFRSRGTNCGRLCAATGASDHHTGLTCDLLDPTYGTSLDTGTYQQHVDWQWLRENSYKYGFIDRFPEAWAGGSMDEPLNVDANGSTGLFETWHYRYVGVEVATEIATGKYNNGQYDSLEHYLKARGMITDLLNGRCYNN